MPAATAPISPTPSGFTKPAGFSHTKDMAADDDDEPKKDHPVILGIAVVALLLMAYVCYMQYNIDQMPGRQSDDMRVFGAPGAGSSEDSAPSAADEESDSEDSGDSEDSASADDSDDEEEE